VVGDFDLQSSPQVDVLLLERDCAADGLVCFAAKTWDCSGVIYERKGRWRSSSK